MNYLLLGLGILTYPIVAGDFYLDDDNNQELCALLGLEDDIILKFEQKPLMHDTATQTIVKEENKLSHNENKINHFSNKIIDLKNKLMNAQGLERKRLQQQLSYYRCALENPEQHLQYRAKKREQLKRYYSLSHVKLKKREYRQQEKFKKYQEQYRKEHQEEIKRYKQKYKGPGKIQSP